ncbi:WecB/TagA/CpsF family glycosyltransferase [Vibrio cholerae]|uniref:WecB/TagA/CpsF family glycosyltransferase n=1 Tax=Vibrio cholerae TaxID=666 RepID=UPI0035AA75F6
MIFPEYDIEGISVIDFVNMDNLVQHSLKNSGIYVSIASEAVINSENDFRELTRKPYAFCYPDGFGTVLAIRSKYGKKTLKLAGCEFWLQALKKSNDKRVALVGGKKLVVTKVKDILTSEYQANVCYFSDGYFNDNSQVIENIKNKNIDIVIVALGQPKQEMFSEQLFNECSNLSIFCVGGSFDVLAGTVKRAPKFMVAFNLEWLYRLLKEPSRIKRQLAIPKMLKWCFKTYVNRIFNSIT